MSLNIVPENYTQADFNNLSTDLQNALVQEANVGDKQNLTAEDLKSIANKLIEFNSVGIVKDDLTLDSVKYQAELNLKNLKHLTSADLKKAVQSCVSMNAMILALLADATSEAIKNNRKANYEAQMSKADLLITESKEILNQAKWNFAFGMISAGISIGMGLMQGYQAAKMTRVTFDPNGLYAKESAKLSKNVETLKKASTKNADAIANAEKAYESFQSQTVSTFAENLGKTIGLRTEAYTSGLNALSKLSDSLGSYFSARSDAKMKKFEADSAKLQASIDSIKDLNDSLKELLTKALQSIESIEQGNAETNRRVLV